MTDRTPMTEPIWYEAHDDGFACVHQADQEDDPNILFVTKEVSVGYTFEPSGNYITHKHGPPALIEKWAQETRAKLAAAYGEAPMSMNPRIVTTDRWDVADLNWVTQNINGLNRLAQKLAKLGLVL